MTELEQQLAEYVGVKHCVTCGNGTDALSMVMMAWDVKPGDAVFVPDFTFFASGEVVSFEGATPVFYDVCEETFNADVASLECAIQAVIEEGILRPRAIVAVDLFGQPADYVALQEVAKKYNLLLLEDGAQGLALLLRQHGRVIQHFRTRQLGDDRRLFARELPNQFLNGKFKICDGVGITLLQYAIFFLQQLFQKLQRLVLTGERVINILIHGIDLAMPAAKAGFGRQVLPFYIVFSNNYAK